MSRSSRIFLIIFLTIACQAFLAGNVEIKASVNADKIGLDDTLIYTLSISGIRNPLQPKLSFAPNFQVTGTSTRSNTVIGNNGMINTIEFQYYLSPLKTGTFTLPASNFEYDGKKYKTRSFKVEVVQGSVNPPTPKRQRPSIFDFDPFDDDAISPFRRSRRPQEIDVRIKTDIDKKQVYVGEPVLFRILLYTRNTIESVTPLSTQTIPGFWAEWFPTPRTIDGTTEEVNGQQYKVFEIRKVTLFPLKEGKLSIPPLKFQFGILDGSITFFSNARNVIRSTPTVDVTVKALPPEAENLPVGDFSFEILPGQKEVDINDIYTLKIKIVGSGNIKTLAVPKLRNNDDYRVYPAKVSRNFVHVGDRLLGSVEAEIPLTFKKSGEIKIPAINFKYFDPKTARVVGLESQPTPLMITGKKEVQESTLSLPRSDILKKGEDISFIKKGEIFDQTRTLAGSGFYKFLLLLPFIVNLIFLTKRFVFDRVIARSEIWSKKKLLNRTVKELNQVREYGEIAAILETYLQQKSGLGLAEINSQAIEELMVDKGVRNRDIDQFIRIKSESESSKFSPVKKSRQELKQDLKMLVEILKRIDKKIK